MMPWRGRRVFLTGHTGFKGGWLGLWLESLGAEVIGYSLEAPPRSLYRAAGLAGRWQENIADIRNLDEMRAAVAKARPSVIFHLAAQPLVLASHDDPVGTYSTNVMGTVNLLEAARACSSVEAIVVATTDKVYRNAPQVWNYREGDTLGGDDPYSSSKACAEHVVAAYRASFFAESGAPLLATARAGNVIGGGDWSANRLLPDLIHAFSEGKPVQIRYPEAIRPWQFVLDPLSGYLRLAEKLLEGRREFAESWNFGPPPTAFRSVMDVVRLAADAWGEGAAWDIAAQPAIRETGRLALDAAKAVALLDWRSRMDLRQAIDSTIRWHRAIAAGSDPLAVTQSQIDAYDGQGGHV